MKNKPTPPKVDNKSIARILRDQEEWDYFSKQANAKLKAQNNTNFVLGVVSGVLLEKFVFRKLDERGGVLAVIADIMSKLEK